MKAATKASLALASGLALALAPALHASADVQAQSADIVGVGSDTVQYLANFIADGDANGHAGYNASHLSGRLVNYDATGDAFGSLTTGVGIVERAGQKPVVRPDGSGTGYDALNADASGSIQYVRASSKPNGGRINAANAAFGGFHAYRVTTDDVKIAVSGRVASNVPADLTTSELNAIYSANPTTAGDLTTCPTFDTVIGRGSATEIAHPVIPQSGSGTYNSFIASIGIAAPGGCTTTVQEHDPIPIQNNADALGPFSNGRLTLINAGYFSNKNINAGAVALQSGTFPAARSLYIVLRQNDLGSISNATIASALFANVVGAYTKSAANNLYASAGFTKSFLDCEAGGAPANTFC